MKKLFTVILLIVFCAFKVNAQFVYWGEVPGGDRYKVNDDRIEQLKTTTVVFIVPDYVYAELPTYQHILKKYWTATPVLIKPVDSAENYFNSLKYSILIIDQTVLKYADGFKMKKQLDATNYRLWMPIAKKKEKVEMEAVGYTGLVWSEIEKTGIRPAIFDLDSANTAFLYKRRKYINFLPGFFAVMVNDLNHKLLDGYNSKLEKLRNPPMDSVGMLAKDTLYVLHSSLIGSKNTAGFRTSMDLEKLKEYESSIQEDYGHPIKFVDAAEMSDRILGKPACFYTILSDIYICYFNNVDFKVTNIDVRGTISKSFFKKLAKAINKANSKE